MRCPLTQVHRLLQCIAFVLLVSILGDSLAYAETPTLPPATAKQMVQARGVGKGIKVKEADGTTIRGKIVSIGEDSFGVQVGSKAATEISYAQVTMVQRPGLSTWAKVGILLGVAVAATAAISVAYDGEHSLPNSVPGFNRE